MTKPCWLAAILGSLTLTGCGSFSSFEQYTGPLENTSQIDIEHGGFEWLFLAGYSDGETCEKSSNGTLVEGSADGLPPPEKRRVAFPLQPNQAVRFVVERNKPFTFNLTLSNPSIGISYLACTMVRTFIPTADKYKLRVVQRADSTRCAVIPYSSDGTPLVAVNRTMTTPFFGLPVCHPLTDDQRKTLGLPLQEDKADPAANAIAAPEQRR